MFLHLRTYGVFWHASIAVSDPASKNVKAVTDKMEIVCFLWPKTISPYPTNTCLLDSFNIYLQIS